MATWRSRYYQYEVRPSVWYSDGSSDLGRIQRQNAIIEAVINKAKSSYNPLTVNALLGSIVNDITKDDAMVRRLLLNKDDTYADYTRAAFEHYLQQWFRIDAHAELPGGTRFLYRATALG